MGTSSQIIALAKASGIPFVVVSTWRPGARTKSGGVSFHASDDAVDFGGFNQDALAAYFMGMDAEEVFHKSLATGRWYGMDNGTEVNEGTHQQLVKDHENHLHVAMNASQVKNVKPSNPFLAGLGTAAKAALGPFDAAASVVDVLRPIGVIGLNLANPLFWRRIGMGVVGTSLILIGILYLNRRAITDTAGRFGGMIGNVAGTAVQGAAFGAGAGATGALGVAKKPVSSAPVTGPYPPRRALPSNAPVTSVLPEAYAPISPGGTYSVTAVGRAKRPAAPLPDLGGSGKPKKPKTSPRQFTPSVVLREEPK